MTSGEIMVDTEREMAIWKAVREAEKKRQGK